jgi:hypothetical protein
MARIHHVKRAQQRYEMVPVLNEDGSPKVTPVLREDGTPRTTRKGRPIERRVTTEDRSKPKPNLTCGKCGNEIEVGQPYKWVKIKSGPYGGRTMVRCATCPTWRQSELTTSNMSGIYAAQERLDDELQSVEDYDGLVDLASSLADEIRDVANLYNESADNMEEGFGHSTYQSDELREKGESLESWADEVEGTDFEEFDEDEFEEQCMECEGTGQVEDRDNPEADVDGNVQCEQCGGEGTINNSDSEEAEEARQSWLDEQRSKLEDTMGNCPI